MTMVTIYSEMQLDPVNRMALFDELPSVLRQAMAKAPAPPDLVKVVAAYRRGIDVYMILAAINADNWRNVPWGDTGEPCPSTKLGMRPVGYDH